MKKITLKNLVLVAVACMTFNTVSAQQRVVTNTVSPKDLTAYNGFAAAVIAGVNAVLSGKTLL